MTCSFGRCVSDRGAGGSAGLDSVKSDKEDWMSETFAAVVIEEEDGKAVTRIKQLSLTDLPDREVLVEIAFSSLNYKDGLAVGGNKNKVARSLPMVAGIDLAGTVVESRSSAWQAGDKVICNGWGMSETVWGGFSKYQRVDADWLVALPPEFSFEQAMGIGTAGYTAALCVDALERWGSLDDGGRFLVTGAAGGVGSVAVALLAARGIDVTASTGREETHAYLGKLGARQIVSRAELAAPGRPLQKELWTGAIDSVGSTTLANVLAQTVYGGAVAACGLAAGMDLPATVLPHILRSVALIGVDSVMAPIEKRRGAWRRLAADLKPELLSEISIVEPMSAIERLGKEILSGQVRGRVIVDVAR